MDADNTLWAVGFSAKVRKQRRKLPENIAEAMDALVSSIEQIGPEQKDWPNYSKLVGEAEKYHCHLNKSRPCYVAVWQVTDEGIKFIEVKYVGTHEGAPY